MQVKETGRSIIETFEKARKKLASYLTFAKRDADEVPDSLRIESIEALLHKDVTEIYDLAKQKRFAEGIGLSGELLNFLAETYQSDIWAAQVLMAKATCYMWSGEYSAAERIFRKALELGENEQDLILVAVIHKQLGFLSRFLGNCSNGEHHYMEALHIIKDKLALGECEKLEAEIYYLIGCVYLACVDFPKGIHFFQESLRVLGNHDNIFALNPLLSLNAAILGGYYDGNDQTQLLERTIRIIEDPSCQDDLEVADASRHMAFLLLQRDSDDCKPLATSLLQRALSIRERRGGPEDIWVANIYIMLASCGNPDEEPLIQRALHIINNSNGTDASDDMILSCFHKLGDYFYKKQAYTKAEGAYQEAYQKTSGLIMHGIDMGGYFLAKIAKTKYRLQDYPASSDLLKETNIKQMELTSKFFEFSSEREQLDIIDSCAKKFNMHFHIVSQFLSRDSKALADIYDVWLRYKGIVLESQKQFREVLLCSDDPTVLGILNEYRTVLSQLRCVYLQSAQAVAINNPLAMPPDHIMRLTTKKDSLESELSRSCQHFLVSNQIMNADLQTLKKYIPDYSVLIDFARIPIGYPADNVPHPFHYFAYVVRNGESDSIHLFDLGDAEEIDELVTQFKIGASKPDAGRSIIKIVLSNADLHRLAKQNEPSLKECAHNLYKKVLLPYRETFRKATDLFISPDGQLALLPFEALVDEDDTYLIEKYTFNYVTAPREMVSYGLAEDQASKSLIMGAPDFGMDLPQGPDHSNASFRTIDKLRKFEPLDGTKDESESVHRLLGPSDSELHTGKEARESVLMDVASPKFLHLATHGFFLEGSSFLDHPVGQPFTLQDPNVSSSCATENPLFRSGFALAGANSTLVNPHIYGSEGIVTADKILNLKLSGTEMVVLSACETGLGAVKNGEGVFGLRRAFSQAGAKSLVMSMWKVPDGETKDLIIEFYKNIVDNKMNRCVALQRAALSIKNQIQRRHDHTHPYFWGAFIFSGDRGRDGQKTVSPKSSII